MHNKKNIIEILGWYGTLAIIGAYFLVSFKIITVDNLMYQLLNLTGAIGLVAISLAKGAKQPAVLNVFWALIAFVAILGMVIY